MHKNTSMDGLGKGTFTCDKTCQGKLIDRTHTRRKTCQGKLIDRTIDNPEDMSSGLSMIAHIREEKLVKENLSRKTCQGKLIDCTLTRR